MTMHGNRVSPCMKLCAAQSLLATALQVGGLPWLPGASPPTASCSSGDTACRVCGCALALVVQVGRGGTQGDKAGGCAGKEGHGLKLCPRLPSGHEATLQSLWAVR